MSSLTELIDSQHDRYVERSLSDLMLMGKYLRTTACKSALKVLEDTSTYLVLDERQKREFMKRIVPMIIPAGVKAVVRGAALNDYIRNMMIRYCKDKKDWKVAFEVKACPHVTEIPDWTLQVGKTGPLIIGFNQLDLWKGGAQINRGAKYILDDGLHERLRAKGVHLVCIVARRIDVVGKKASKLQRILEKGIATKRLMWPRGLKAYLSTLTL